MKMRMMKAVAATALTVASLMVAGGAEAALVERLGGKAIYDEDADLTWLQDANYAQTSGYDTDGLMTLSQANTWAGSLNIDGVAGWRLPSTWNHRHNGYGSELQQMYFQLGGGSHYPWDLASTHNENYNLFRNIRQNCYLDGTPEWYWHDDGSLVYSFGEGNGGYARDRDPLNPAVAFAWAVRTGDVGASPVPVPGALALMGPALFGLMGANRRRRSGAALG